MPRNTTRNTIQRQWELLSLLPRSSGWLSTAELRDQLHERGFEVDQNTVRRDLLDLTRSFQIGCRKKDGLQHWGWEKDAVLPIAGLDVSTALSLVVMRDTLKHLLPQSVLSTLNPQLESAKRKLDEIAGRKSIARWKDKVLSLPQYLSLLPAEVSADVLETVQDALLKDLELDVTYRSGRGTSRRLLYPRGLLQRGPKAYLLADSDRGKDIHSYVLHRILQARCTGLTIPARPFSLRRHAEEGNADFGSGKLIELEAIVSQNLADLLQETPISQRSRLDQTAMGIRLRTSVRDTWQLHGWILAQGEHIAILQPTELRQYIAGRIQKSAGHYQQAQLARVG